ncbi:RNA-guided endonuclease IscB [Streptomyces sp. NPDC005017]|uniref:RNA-guided endonuclease IscB n=1 Tax=Streptomyces sp. NPDC005017 TaxID=3364706 RepID=UPI0036AE7357
MLSREGRPLMPCHPARARELLGKGRAAVARQVPFTIRLKDRAHARSEVDGVQLRIDPGSRGAGLALTDERKQTNKDGALVTVRRGLIAVELRHRGDRIHGRMEQRAGYRRRRRSANCRYRAPRSKNRRRPPGWLPPSLRHRVDTLYSLADRLCRSAPVTGIHLEKARFDTHSLSAGRRLRGAEHEQGPLVGSSTRAYLRARWQDACAYCDATGVPLNIEHLTPRSRGGSSRIANLVLACIACNEAKGTNLVEVFLAQRSDRLARILQQVGASLRDAAAMNTTGEQLVAALSSLGRCVHVSNGESTMSNRAITGLAKTHTLDALCVGQLDHEAGDAIVRFPGQVTVVRSTGRGSYARTTPDRYGFPRLRRTRVKQHFGYVTGDLVRAVIRSGRWAGTWTGRVSVRARGQHRLTTPAVRFNVSHRNLELLQRGDGYAYDVRREPEGPYLGKPVELSLDGS